MNGKDKVMVVGSGGREHALAWKLVQSPHVEKVYVAPGSDGIGQGQKCESVPIKVSEYQALANFAKEHKIDLTVVGPEQPLVDGIADLFLENGLRLLGPSRTGAKLEGNKAYAKDFMQTYAVPTAGYKILYNYSDALDFLEHDWRGPVFVKASGLAAGKGALPGLTQDSAIEAARRIMKDKEFGDAGNEIVIEKYIVGEEASFMALLNSDAMVIVPLLPSQDHKRLHDNDEGPNTGGMGAYAPTRLVTSKLDEKVKSEIMFKTMIGLRHDKTSYTGAIYPGLMISNEKPYVLEYNVRMGDPETQPVLSLLESDFYEALNDVIDGKTPELKWKDGYAICVVLASKGYPQSPEKGKLISGLDLKRDNIHVFHAGTKYEDGKFYTNGGRVLGVTGLGKTIEEARNRAYEAVDTIKFDGMHFRKDIGYRELVRNR